MSTISTTHLPAYQTLLDRVAELEARCERLAKVARATCEYHASRSLNDGSIESTIAMSRRWSEIRYAIGGLARTDLDPPPGERSA